MRNQLVAAVVGAGLLSAGIGLAAPAAANTGGAVGCSPCDRVVSAAAEAVQSGVESSVADALESAGSSNRVVQKWTNYPGEAAEKWAGFPGRQAEKWTGAPGRTAKKWTDFPRRTISKWTGLG